MSSPIRGGAPAKRFLACAWLGVAAAAGCGGGGGPAEPEGPAVFPAEVLTTAPSSSGQLTVDVRTDPQPPVRGSIRAQMTIVDVNGQPVDGLDLAVVPWMPSHGHGTSITPSVSAQGGGLYLVDQLYLYMGGTWELRTTISGVVDDEAVAQVDVP
jgi:hypothetical protein